MARADHKWQVRPERVSLRVSAGEAKKERPFVVFTAVFERRKRIALPVDHFFMEGYMDCRG